MVAQQLNMVAEYTVTTIDLTKNRRVNVIDTNKLIVDNMNIVHRAVRDCHVNSNLYDDAVAEGMLALVKAANNFEQSGETKFTSYAYKCVKGWVRWFITKSQSPVEYRTEVYKLGNKIRKFMQDKTIENICDVKLSDLGIGEISDDVYSDAVSWLGGTTVSLDSTIDDEEETTLVEVIDCGIDVEAEVSQSWLLDVVEEFINEKYVSSTDANRGAMLDIVKSIYLGNSDTLEEIAERRGISDTRARQLKKKLFEDEEFRRLMLEYLY